MKRLLLTISFGVLLLGIGAGMLLYQIRSRESSIVATPPVTTYQLVTPPAMVTKGDSQKPVTTGKPVQLTIPSLNISLPIIDGYYDTKSATWTLTKDKVQYAAMTPAPNDALGNTFIYGHARKGVFATLPSIKSGAEAIVTTDNGHRFRYVLTSNRTVTPENSAGIFDYTCSPILTIQTRTGLFYQNRDLFTFSLAEVV